MDRKIRMRSDFCVFLVVFSCGMTKYKVILGLSLNCRGLFELLGKPCTNLETPNISMHFENV